MSQVRGLGGKIIGGKATRVVDWMIASVDHTHVGRRVHLSLRSVRDNGGAEVFLTLDDAARLRNEIDEALAEGRRATEAR